jgi:hypothetical protein
MSGARPKSAALLRAEALIRQPIGGYVPPPSLGAAAGALATPPGGAGGPSITDKYETFYALKDLAALNVGSLAAPIAVGSTSKYWRGIDVYVQPYPGDSGVRGVVSVYVHAVVRGMRTLVASGQVVVSPSQPVAMLQRPLLTARWAVAARGGAETYEVSARWSQFVALGVQAGSVAITAIASNDVAEPPPGVGVEPFAMVSQRGPEVQLGDIGLLGSDFPVAELELVSVQAINELAGLRFLHLHDVPVPTASVDGVAPLFNWPIGTSPLGLIDNTVRYRARGFLVLVSSATAGVTTADGVLRLSAQVR